ncbi:hypothetical protein BKA59DRAFT_534387 [Fusarium tricinctum]|uniref:Uncharacterized protein n=1 Tax=Fusarium tricinctum TaxID=61284 RepID=A0A8K0RNQ7_9HYPO|nr:hypothetical protein BKA59DRAFT_534387 [Fusarium tricinctum]
MSIRLSDMFDLIWKPPRGPPIVKRRPLDKMLPENFKYFRNWGFTIYRTYYGAESDEHWNTLVTILRHQTSLALGLLESEELREDDDEWIKRCGGDKSKWANKVNIVRELFRLFPREDASLLDGLDIAGVREVCAKEHDEATEKMAGAFLNLHLLQMRQCLRMLPTAVSLSKLLITLGTRALPEATQAGSSFLQVIYWRFGGYFSPRT